ncbi:MAG TPA: hypothetical protein VN735_03635 [Steroidobacteraceae bacterium]|nr:hypothetical protein [Steroidobacteraceae bacterium]
MKADAAGVMSWQKRRSITTRFQALTEISWDEFFKEFEQRKLALLCLYEEDSLFSKIIGRDTAERRHWSFG